MATKSSPTPDVDLEAMLADLDASSSAPSKPVTSTSTAPNKKLTRVQTAEDIDTELADLESLVNAQPNRPHTPRVSTPVGGKSARMSSDVQRSASGRNSEDNRGRKSGESGRNTSSGYGFTPSASTSEGSGKQVTVEEEKFENARPPQKKVEQAPAPAATGGWWGSLVSAATTAAKTAEAAVKEIQSNEEAKRWAEQVKGNVGVLRGLGKLPSPTRLLLTPHPVSPLLSKNTS